MKSDTRQQGERPAKMEDEGLVQKSSASFARQGVSPFLQKLNYGKIRNGQKNIFGFHILYPVHLFPSFAAALNFPSAVLLYIFFFFKYYDVLLRFLEFKKFLFSFTKINNHFLRIK